MKKLFYSLCCLLALCACQGNSGEFKFTMKVQEGETSKMFYIYHTDSADYSNVMAVIDSVPVVDGKIEYVTKLDQLALGFIANGTQENATSMYSLFLVPGEECEATCDGEELHVDGSEFYAQMHQADEAVAKQKQAVMDFISDAQQQLENAGEGADSLHIALETKYEELFNKVQDDAKAYLKQHSKEAGVVAQMFNTLTYEDVLSLMDLSVKEGVMKPYFDYVQKQMDAQKERETKMLEAKKKVADGAEAPDFTLNDINGQPLTLSSLRGKYLVLDWWGSWCGWCIKGIPDMKEYYQKYAGKLEILGIDCNDSEEDWKKAVADNELPWKHVYNPQSSTLPMDYAIEGFPTKIVLSPEGTILKTVVGEDPAFYTYLDSLLAD